MGEGDVGYGGRTVPDLVTKADRVCEQLLST